MPPANPATAPRVFISYAHESPEHRADVLEFAAFLRGQGIDAVLDVWFERARQDWYAWALREMSETDYVIVVASEKYRWITDGGGENQYKGVRSEEALLRELIYTDRDRWFPRILPVLLPGHHPGEIPLFLQPHSASFFSVRAFTVPGAECLLRVILRQPAHVAPPVAERAPILRLPPHVPCTRGTPVRVHPPVPRQLPLAVRDFVGRGGLLTTLDGVAARGNDSAARVVTLDGAAGVGKTTLAVYWGHRAQAAFPDGTLFANLRGYGLSMPLDPVRVLVSFLRALGITDERAPAELDVLVGLYRSLVADRRMLIVLDNAGSADQVRPLLPGSPGCMALVTSRAMLTGLIVAEAAHRFSLDLFTPDEAEALVRGVIGADRVAAEPDAAGELVRLCAGLPLAVRVAASRVAVRGNLSITDVVDDIAQPQARLDMPGGSHEGGAVRAVLDWSYARLTAEQSRTFRCLGLHPLPEFDVHAAAALAGTDVTDAHRNLEALADVHLLEPSGRKRYRFHDLLHIYAADRAESDDTVADRRRALLTMITWYAQTATTADRLVFPAHPALPMDLGEPVHEVRLTDRAEGWAWLTAERDTLPAVLRQAAEHRMADASIAIAAAARFLAMQPRVLWSRRLAAESYGLLAASASGNRAAEAVLRGRRADTHQMLSRWSEADADLERVIELADAFGDPVLRGDALCGLGRNRKLQHRYAEAQRYYQQALPLVRGAGTGYLEAVVECNLSQISARLGQHHDALRHARRELFLRQECGDRVGKAYALHNMALAVQGLGNHRAALELGECARASYRTSAATDQFLAEVLETMATSLDHLGDHVRAGHYLREAAAILTECGDPRAEILRSRADGGAREPVVTVPVADDEPAPEVAPRDV